VTDFLSPLQSLQEGYWFKLICGASFQHLPAIRSLTLAYALAGADCIDVAADPAIIATAREALAVADKLIGISRQKGFKPGNSPWLMVSLNDGEDPHFRKAEFQAANCPADCSRPCEAICPAEAIVFQNHPSGVIDTLCYGCGRCLPICPIQNISTRSYVYTPDVISPLILQAGVDAIEIHTQIGRLSDFKRLWRSLSPQAHHLKLLSISCPDGEGLIDYLWSLQETIAPLPCALIWQTDGRPMSGDIGAGATRASVKLGEKVLAANLPGYVQLAGGTNAHTVPKLKALGLLPNKNSTIVSRKISGIAYGSYARSLLLPVLNQLEAMEIEPLNVIQRLSPHFESATVSSPTIDRDPLLRTRSATRLETVPSLLWQAVELSHTLISPLKSSPQKK
jgi:Fe-S-cluster-containing hydrogenase component 2